MDKSSLLTAARLRELLRYDPYTGHFTRLVRTSNRIKVGDIAGALTDTGYISITVVGHHYQAHRLAWLYVHGAWPNGEIDHINGCRDDNRFHNIRDVTRTENQQNRRRVNTGSKSGFLGVHWDNKDGTWRARIMVDGKLHFLGRFPTAEEAHAAYLTAKRELHTHCTI